MDKIRLGRCLAHGVWGTFAEHVYLCLHGHLEREIKSYGEDLLRFVAQRPNATLMTLGFELATNPCVAISLCRLCSLVISSSSLQLCITSEFGHNVE